MMFTALLIQLHSDVFSRHISLLPVKGQIYSFVEFFADSIL